MIDWERVEELRDEIGVDDFVEVVDLFLEEADEVVARLQHGLKEPEVVPALHFLKGSALNLGFKALAQLCQKGEQSAHSGDVRNINLGAIVQCYEQSAKAFSQELEAKMQHD